jgi:hypothetical protein
MKLWKFFLIVISVAVLPSALVAVGQAQQLTCWGLRPRIEDAEETDTTVRDLGQQEGSSPLKSWKAILKIGRFLSLRFLSHLICTR